MKFASDINKRLSFNAIIFSAVCVYLLWLILNYDFNWVHPEVSRAHMFGALKDGAGFTWKDLLRCFDWENLDGGPRPRFFSYFFQIINLKFRAWIFRYILPHPSLSLTWIFSLIISPVFLFRLMHKLTLKKEAAWICISLYMVSVGFLSNVAMLFHPAKPLSNFFLIFCLYLASNISSAVKENGSLPKAQTAFLLATMLLAYFTDETCYFIYFALPIFFPEIFFRKGRKILTFLVYTFPFIIFLGFVRFLAPIIARKLGYLTFDYWWFIAIEKPWVRIKLVNFFINANSLFSYHFINAFVPSVYNHIAEAIVYIFALLFGFLRYRQFNEDEKGFFRRILLALFSFVLFHTLLMSRHGQIAGSYYYGSHSSILLSIFLSVLLAGDPRLNSRVNKLILIILIPAFIFGFQSQNSKAQKGHIPMWQKYFPMAVGIMPSEGRLTRALVRRAWAEREHPYTYGEIEELGLPLKAVWLLVEMDYNRDR